MDGNVGLRLQPKLVAAHVKVHTLLIFFALLGGAKAFGIIGLFVGPVILSVTLAVGYAKEHRFPMALKSRRRATYLGQ